MKYQVIYSVGTSNKKITEISDLVGYPNQR